MTTEATARKGQEKSPEPKGTAKIALLVQALGPDLGRLIISGLTRQQQDEVAKATLKLVEKKPLPLSELVSVLDEFAAQVAPAEPTPFQFVERESPARVAQWLAQEPPQVAAVVLSGIAPARAAAVLTALPDALRAQVLPRLDHPVTAPAVMQQRLALGLLLSRSRGAGGNGHGKGAMHKIARFLDPRQLPAREPALSPGTSPPAGASTAMAVSGGSHGGA